MQSREPRPMTFVTEVQANDGPYMGPEIHALTWEEAEDIAGKIMWQGQSVHVIGKLDD